MPPHPRIGLPSFFGSDRNGGGCLNLKKSTRKRCSLRLIEGLYLAGELLDIDADTGGYNLQIAYSTGHLAGELLASQPI